MLIGWPVSSRKVDQKKGKQQQDGPTTNVPDCGSGPARPGPYMVRQSSRWIWIGQGYGATNRADGERATTHLPSILPYTPHTTDLYKIFLALTFFIKKYFISFVRSLFWILIVPLCSTRRDEQN